MTNIPTGAHGTLSPGAIAAALAPYKVSLNDGQVAQIKDYVTTLLSWNQMVSLTAIEEPSEIVARHFGESIFADSIVRIRSGRLADVGTGAGFPGIPLKIAFPRLEVTLFESNRRKCAFLREVVQKLGIDGVEIKATRYEDDSPRNRRFDFVCARALGDYPMLLRWAREVATRDGRVLLWVGAEDSIRVGRVKGWTWDPPVPIPESQRRVVMAGRVSIRE